MKVKLPCIVLAMSLVGCATTGPKEGYVYTPNKLSELLIGNLYEATSKLNQEENLSAVFVEDQALLKIEINAGRDSRYMWGVPGKRLHEQLCTSDDGFFVAIRESGVGIEYTLVDESNKQTFGPWNAAACL